MLMARVILLECFLALVFVIVQITSLGQSSNDCPRNNDQNTVDFVNIIIENSTLTDDSAILTDNITIYKRKGNNLYSDQSKNTNQTAQAVFFNDNDDYVTFYLKKGKKLSKIGEGYWSLELSHDGYFITFHDNGQKRSEGVYVYNTETGPFYYYDENGALVDSVMHSSDFIDCIGSNQRMTMPR